MSYIEVSLCAVRFPSTVACAAKRCATPPVFVAVVGPDPAVAGSIGVPSGFSIAVCETHAVLLRLVVNGKVRGRFSINTADEQGLVLHYDHGRSWRQAVAQAKIMLSDLEGDTDGITSVRGR